MRCEPGRGPPGGGTAPRAVRVEEHGKLDLERELRTGVPEVILAEGKSVDEVVSLAIALHGATGLAIVTRAGPELAERLARELPVKYHARARIAVACSRSAPREPQGTIGILTGGTSDIPVAEEARVMAEALGCRTVVEHDVGVAGLHRLTDALERVGREADVLVVVAGREGALAPVVAGLSRQPVIGVPTSSGYGYGGGGEAALMTMLQSCSPLLTVNVDAGVIAGMMAYKVLAAPRGTGD
ncbi:MAG: nickel pincer cofactor biosynthesis protein LarB [Thermoplasmata archaeon]|nr:nickel pincer cofactor biosynthesis protein LarB [Thermoplasmata archaeon]